MTRERNTPIDRGGYIPDVNGHRNNHLGLIKRKKSLVRRLFGRLFPSHNQSEVLRAFQTSPVPFTDNTINKEEQNELLREFIRIIEEHSQDM